MDTLFAYNLGASFADYLNECGVEAQNWAKLGDIDAVPDEDYRQIVAHYGQEYDDNAREIERAYKKGFNEKFCG